MVITGSTQTEPGEDLHLVAALERSFSARYI